MESSPPCSAVLQLDGSFLCVTSDGSSVRYSRRLDGSWRTPERRRAGWIGDLEIPRYRPPHRNLRTLTVEKRLQLMDALAAHVALSLKRSRDFFLASSTVSLRIWFFLGPVLDEPLAYHLEAGLEKVANCERFVANDAPLPQLCTTSEDSRPTVVATSISSRPNELQGDVEYSIVSFVRDCLKHSWRVFLSCVQRSSNSDGDCPCTQEVLAGRSADSSFQSPPQTTTQLKESYLATTDDSIVPLVSYDVLPADAENNDYDGLPSRPATCQRSISGKDHKRLQFLRIPTPARASRNKQFT